MLFLAQLCPLYWTCDQPSHSKSEAKRTTVQRLLKPCTPLDCPICRLSCTFSSVVEPSPTPLPPWRELKSRRGAPKRINIEGFACPNRECPYFGITDAHIHAPLWGWHTWPCRADPDVSLSGLPRHFQCPTPHPIVPAQNTFSPDRSCADGTSL